MAAMLAYMTNLAGEAQHAFDCDTHLSKVTDSMAQTNMANTRDLGQTSLMVVQGQSQTTPERV